MYCTFPRKLYSTARNQINLNKNLAVTAENIDHFISHVCGTKWPFWNSVHVYIFCLLVRDAGASLKRSWQHGDHHLIHDMTLRNKMR